MKILLRINHTMQEFETDRLEIELEDKEFSIIAENNNTLVLNKNGFGTEGNINIQPCVSNEIKIK